MPLRGFRLPEVLRAVVLALATPVLVWAVVTDPARVAASLAALFGALVAARLARPGGSRGIRLRAVALAAVLTTALGWVLARLLLWSSAASLLGATLTVDLSQIVFCAAAVFGAVLTLRLAVEYHPTVAVLEMGIVATAFAAGLAAHRNGQVNRPLLIGDWAWIQGIDPTLVFLGLGGGCVLLLAGLLVSEQRVRRLPLHFAGLAGVAVVLMLLIRTSGLPEPRVPADLGLTGDAEQQQEGGGENSDDLQMRDLPFKDEYSQAGQQAPVAVVLLRDDYSPPSGVYYFRQSVFSQYNGRRLVQSVRDDVDRDIVRQFPSAPFEVPERPPKSRHRSSLRTSVGLIVDHVKPFALDSPVRVVPTQNPSPLRFQRTFDAVSLVPTMTYEQMLGQQAGDDNWSDDIWAYYTEQPEDSRYRELADEMVGILNLEYRDDPLGRALAVKMYLDENGKYSRKSRHADADDPAASFLFGDLTGYCVHFAHASVYLLRSLGIPARVAAGYAVPEDIRADGSALMIQGLNAHAWPEVYLDGVGWVVVDLAPQTVLDEMAPQPDPALQQMLADLLRGEESLESYLATQRQPRDYWLYLLWSLAALLGLGLLAALVIKAQRRLTPRWASPAQLPRLAYRAALDGLAEVGVRRDFGESREAFASRLALQFPSFSSLSHEHLRAALGAGARRDPDELRALLLGLRPELTTAIPGWRRWLGRANPLSWWSVR